MKKIFTTSILFSIIFITGSYFAFFKNDADLNNEIDKRKIKVTLHGAFVKEGPIYVHEKTKVKDIIYKYRKANVANLTYIKKTWNRNVYNNQSIELIYKKGKWLKKPWVQVLADKWLLKHFHINRKIIKIIGDLIKKKHKVNIKLLEKTKGIGPKTLISISKIAKLPLK